jgi:hypothetical protein
MASRLHLNLNFRAPLTLAAVCAVYVLNACTLIFFLANSMQRRQCAKTERTPAKKERELAALLSDCSTKPRRAGWRL